MTGKKLTKRDFEEQIGKLQNLADKDVSMQSTMKLLEGVERLVEIGEGDEKSPFQLPYSSPALNSHNKTWKLGE